MMTSLTFQLKTQFAVKTIPQHQSPCMGHDSDRSNRDSPRRGGSLSRGKYDNSYRRYQ